MPLTPNFTPFITCAVTGSGGTQNRSPHVPRSPEQIAASAIDAAKAGAAIVHCHVRDPETGAPDRRVDLFHEVVDRIRDSDTDVIINLTAGMGGDIVFGTSNHLYLSMRQRLIWPVQLSGLPTLPSVCRKSALLTVAP